MPPSTTDTGPRRADNVRVTRDSIVVELTDGRTIKVPLSWYPRLQHATTRERDNWRLIRQPVMTSRDGILSGVVWLGHGEP